MNITIEELKDRKAKRAVRSECSWGDFVDKFYNPAEADMNFSDYKNLPKSEQSNIKDVGGYVLGEFVNSRRGKKTLATRNAITLDIDSGDDNILFTLENILGFECLMHSTANHTPEEPRYRIIIPLTRSVKGDQYTSISKWIANSIGVEYFDKTTFQPERLMYYPLAFRDKPVEVYHIKGDMLNPDDIEYSTEVNNSAAEIEEKIKNLSDPRDKENIVGAFCRAYTVTEALEKFIPGTYTHAYGDRYTYKDATTSGGAVLYEDLWIYSFHGSDPYSYLALNAFDLVRLHKFGSFDSSRHVDTPVDKLPSFTKLGELLQKDERCAAELVKIYQNRSSSAESDFEDIEVEVESTQYNQGQKIRGMKDLSIDMNGRIRATIDNAEILFNADPNLKGVFAINAFTGNTDIIGKPPWCRISSTPRIDEHDEASMKQYLERVYGYTNATKIFEGLLVSARHRAFHPIKDYIESTEWDGKPRVDTLLIDYLGAEDTAYTRQAIRKALLACVYRIYEPGKKHDTILTLSGPQGCYKSTFLERLGGDWYTDDVSLHTLDDKDTKIKLHSKWLVEIGELAGMRKAEVEGIKQFVTRTEDEFRKPYARNSLAYPRQFVLFGTTNEKDFLRDATGDRRWNPVDVMKQKPTKNVYKELLGEEVKQIWAEVLLMYKCRESLLMTAEAQKEAEVQQKAHKEEDPRIGIVEEFLERKIPENWYNLSLEEQRTFIDTGTILDNIELVHRDRVCTNEILAVCFNEQLSSKYSNTSWLRTHLNNLKDWEPISPRSFGKNFGKQRGWRKKDD